MKFLREDEVPDHVRAASPAPVPQKPAPAKPDPLVAILERLTALLSKERAPVSTPVDLSAVVKAIRDRPTPTRLVRRWKFSIQRDAYGLIADVIAEPLE